MISRNISVRFVAFALSASGACIAAPGDIWWDWFEDRWCLRTNTNIACLSANFDLERISERRMSFADRIDEDDTYFASFETHSATEGSHTRFVNDSVVLDKMFEQNGLKIALFKPIANSMPVVHLFVVTITVDSRHTLVIHGRSIERITAIYEEFVSQWGVSHNQ